MLNYTQEETISYKICVRPYTSYMAKVSRKKYAGILMDFLVSVAKDAGFKYSLLDTSGPQYYQVKGNSSFIELLNMIHRGECDFLWAPVAASEELAEIMDYTAPVLTHRIIIFSAVNEVVLRKPGATWSILSANPMTLAVLFSVLVILALLTSALERSFYHVTAEYTSVSNILWNYYGTLFLEPIRRNFHTPSLVIIGVWWFGVIVVVSLFGGNLKADLTIQEGVTIETVADVLAKPKLRPIILHGIAYERDMKMSLVNEIANVHARSVRMKGLIKISRAFDEKVWESIKSGDSVLIGPHVAAYILFDLHCKQDGVFYISENDIISSMVPILHRKGLPQHIREKIDQKIRFFSAMKLTEKTERDAALRYKPCMWKPQKAKKSSDALFVSVFWCSGMGIAFIFLMIEILLHKVKQLLAY